MTTTTTLAPPIDEEIFLVRANGRCRTRLFDGYDYARFCEAYRAAVMAAAEGKPFYDSDDAGGVANCYQYVTTSARWGVWTDTDGCVWWLVDRKTISSQHVGCCYYGGDRQYQHDFRKGAVQIMKGAK